jgi:coenzyme F420-reducing hydrogenase alpha subunit
MGNNHNIRIHHLTRVEGHGDIVVEIKNGRLAKVRFDIVEAPRFFEVILRGQHYHEVTHIASRICGICAVSHKCAALKATEAALKAPVTEQTLLLRRLAYHGEVISSHILHVYFLAGPDYFNADSVFPMLQTHREMVLRAMRLKNLGYELSALVAGRHTHPVAMAVGGFTFVHSENELHRMKKRIAEGLDDIQATVQDFKALRIPRFERQTEYVSLTHAEHYAFYEGDMFSSEVGAVAAEHYREMIDEYVVPNSTAKHARWHRPAYMVGALARMNNNYDQLSPLAKESAAEMGLKVPCFNPFMITVAQIVECVHCLEDSLQIIDALLAAGIDPQASRPANPTTAGSGVGVVEAPRGILFHEYSYDDAGRCLSANQVIPTAQNLANIEADMRAFVPQIMAENPESLAHRLEMLVRAYDPCISCATHVLEL